MILIPATTFAMKCFKEHIFLSFHSTHISAVKLIIYIYRINLPNVFANDIRFRFAYYVTCFRIYIDIFPILIKRDKAIIHPIQNIPEVQDASVYSPGYLPGKPAPDFSPFYQEKNR